MDMELLAGITRIAFGLMFLIKQCFTIEWRDVIWAHHRPHGIRTDRLFVGALCALSAATVFFAVGLFTGPAALVQAVLFAYLLRRASIYGLEDTVFHVLCVYFVLAGAGGALSLDAVLGTGVWGRLPPGTVVPELALAAMFALIFLSAGVDKLRSPMWRRGLGAYYFFALPIHRRVSTSFFSTKKPLMVSFSYLNLAMQIGVLPGFLANAIPVGLTLWLLLLGFAIVLSTVFVFTWLGEALILGLVIILGLLVHAGFDGLLAVWIDEIGEMQGGVEYAFTAALLATLAAALWTAVIPHMAHLSGTPVISGINLSMRYIARYVWGFVPVVLFSEKHMQGPVIYRVFVPAAGGGWQELHRVFTPHCMVGPDRIWRPTFVEVIQYKVSEACMEMDEYGEVRTPQRREFILKLAQHIGDKAAKSAGGHPPRVLFRTLQLSPPAHFAGSEDDWRRGESWEDAFSVELVHGRAAAISVLKRPILRVSTGRDISRHSFEFNPRSR